MTRLAIRLFLLAAFVFAPFQGTFNNRWISSGQAAYLVEGSTITVTDRGDEIETNGNCTLREAIIAANTDAPMDACPAGNGTDTIFLATGEYLLSVEGRGEDAAQTGDLDILDALTIIGQGQGLTTINGNHKDRVIQIQTPGLAVALKGLTVRGGEIIYATKAGDDHGAGIWNQGQLSLDDVAVLGNYYLGFGGGIANSGTLFLKNSQVSSNFGRAGLGGGIYNEGQLVLEDSSVNQNRAVDGYGGGIYNTGFALLRNCRVNDNGFNIDQYYAAGGAIYNNQGVMRVDNCTIDGGTAGWGTVIANVGEMKLTGSVVTHGINQWATGESISTDGSLALIETSVIDNASRGVHGSGSLVLQRSIIARNFSASPDDEALGGAGILFTGTVTITQSAIASNLAGDHGGGISGGGNWLIENSAVISNTATRGDQGFGTFATGIGGGISWEDGELRIRNSTLAANRSSDGGAGIIVQAGQVFLENTTITGNQAGNGEGGGIALVRGTVSLHNTLLAGNNHQAEGADAPDCYQLITSTGAGETVESVLFSAGHNLVGKVDGCAWTPGSGDLTGRLKTPLDPAIELIPSTDHTTITARLLPGSPAVDAGDPAGCLTTDQRGIDRPQGAGCDIGAFELEETPHGIEAGIDLRPKDNQNMVNPHSRGSLPVAILSSPGFYAPALVDAGSLTFGRTGDEPSSEKLDGVQEPDCKWLDADGDRLLDLVCRFAVQEMGFEVGDFRAVLKGSLLDGQPFYGIDAVAVKGATTEDINVLDTQANLAAYEGDALLWLPFVRVQAP